MRSFLKNVIFRLFKKKKKTFLSIILLIVTFGAECIFEFSKNKIDMIDSNNIAIASHGLRISALENYRASKDSSAEALVSRTSFNAYIKRKDDEYSRQMLKNDFFYDSIGRINGRLDEIESILYQLNESAINNKSRGD